MNLISDWNKIRRHFNKSFKSNFHVSIAFVRPDGNPGVTPIGTLFFNDNQKAFYFEKFSTKLPSALNKNICCLGVNSNRIFWLKSLFKGKFSNPPALKLYGELGKKRKANPKEIQRLNRRMKLSKGLKGHTYLWKEMPYVREINFTHVEEMNLGAMTANAVRSKNIPYIVI